jgi:hypothetical protein
MRNQKYWLDETFAIIVCYEIFKCPFNPLLTIWLENIFFISEDIIILRFEKNRRPPTFPSLAFIPFGFP